MGILSAFQNSPGFGVGGMTNHAAPQPRPQGPGALQGFMGQLGHQPGMNTQPTYTRPPPVQRWNPDPGAVGPGLDPGTLKYPNGWTPQPGDTVLGMSDAVAMGANPANLEGYGRFNSNSPQNGYPTWNAPFQTTPYTPLQGAAPSAETVAGWGGKFDQPRGGILSGLANMSGLSALGGLFGDIAGGGSGKKTNDELVNIAMGKL